MRSRLGILTDEVSPDLNEALAFCETHGLGHVEIRTVNGMNAIAMTDVQLESIRAQVESRGLTVSCFASPVFKCALSPDRPVAVGDSFGVDGGTVEDNYRLLDTALRATHLLGCTRMRIFSFWREHHPARYEDEIVDHLSHAARIAERAGITLLLENEPACNGGYAAEVARLVMRVNSAYLRALWDPGNEAYAGRPAYPEGHASIRSVAAHVHLKDAHVVDGQSTCVPIGQGAVPYREFLKSLQDEGYSGLFTVETHYVPPGGTARDGSTMTMHGLRTVLAEASLSLGGY